MKTRFDLINLDPGNLFEVVDREDGSTLTFYHIFIVATVGEKKFIHKFFAPYGFGAQKKAESFKERIVLRGEIDLKHWRELPKEPTLEEKWQAESEREQAERMRG